MKKIAVIGSINTDFVFRCKELPKPNETILGEAFEVNFGGKGANEAVASARLGADVTLFGKVGDDLYSAENLKHLKNEGVDVSYVETAKNTSGGSAGIMHGSGTNSIIVVGGANAKVDEDYINRHKQEVLSNDIFCLTLEIPQKTVEYLIDLLFNNGKTVIFNPSPITKLSRQLYNKCTYVIVNEVEVLDLPGYAGLQETLKLYDGKLIVTHGKDGVYLYQNGEVCHKPALKIKNVVDTTGAGDTFLSAFAVAVASEKSFSESIEFANVCAGVKTTKSGAQTGMPKLAEIEHLIKK